MTGPVHYPPADHDVQWYGPGGETMPMNHVKWLIHTTETAGGWPGYDGGLSAPTLTYEPWAHKWRQHFPINGSARALRDPTETPVRENRADVVQTEVSCYCDPGLYKKFGHAVIDLDDQALDDLGAFARWMHVEWGMALQMVDLPWPPYPASLSIDRMGSRAYEDFSGVLGHEHAPGNTHGDPGAMDVMSILIRAGGDDMSAQDVADIKDAIKAGDDRVIEVVRNLATAERDRDAADRERDARQQAALLTAVAAIPRGPAGSLDAAAVEQVIRDVFGSLDNPTAKQ